MAEESTSSSLGGDLFVYAKLLKTVTPEVSETGIQARLIVIEAKDADSAPLSVFVFQREVIDEDASDSSLRERAMFSNVCSPNDFQELPEGMPTDEDVTLFRYHRIEALCKSTAELEYIWTEVKKDVAALVNHHKVIIGYLPDSPNEIAELS